MTTFQEAIQRILWLIHSPMTEYDVLTPILLIMILWVFSEVNDNQKEQAKLFILNV